MTEEAIRKSFGKALRHARRTITDITQEELASRSGYDRSYVGRVERGEANLSLGAMVKLAWAAGVPTSELFHDIDSHGPEDIRRQPD